MEIPQLSPEIDNFLKKEGLEAKTELPQDNEFPAFLTEKAAEIAEISGSWNPVEIYTADPESISQEKAAFLEAFENKQEYTPQFTYSAAEQMKVAESREQLQKLLHEIRVMEVDRAQRTHRLAKAALYAKVRDDLATCDLIEGIQEKDEAKIGLAIPQKYRPLDEYLIEAAHNDYEQRTQTIAEPDPESTSAGLVTPEERTYLEEKTFNAEEVKTAFEWGLKRLGILKTTEDSIGFQVLISKQATDIDVRDKSIQGPTVFIPPTHELNGIQLLNLLAHEIGAHARQSMNGEKLFKIGGGALKIDDETLYEGLAMRKEEEFQKQFFGQAGDDFVSHYVLAAEKAASGKSFQEIFEDQLEIRLHVALTIAPEQPLPSFSEIDKKILDTAKNAAWRTTYRTMRGHTDTSNPEGFAMTKDLAYFQGSLLDKELVKNGLGHINEAAVLKSGGLQMLAEFNIQPTDLPIPDQDLAKAYWEEELQPALLRSKIAQIGE